MKKRAKKIVILFFVVLFSLGTLSGCVLREKTGEMVKKIEWDSEIMKKVNKFFSYYDDEEKVRFEAAAKEGGKTGMVVAIGGGFDTEERFRPLIDKCLSHVAKTTPKMLFLPTAHRDELEENEEIVEWFKNAGCETDILLVSKASETEIQVKIAWADIIYETGGNLKFLTETWKEKGVYAEVKKAYDRGAALIGVSSGAMCWAEKGWDDCGDEVFRVIDRFPFLGKDASYDFYDCAGILPFCICPHYDNVAWKMYLFKAVRQDFPSLCIDNGAAVVCCGGEYEVVSDEKTPRRKAYLTWPARKMCSEDVKAHPEYLTYLTGERK